MNLLLLLRGPSPALRRDLLVAAFLSAIANAGILVIVSTASAQQQTGARMLMLFLCAAGLYVLGLRVSYGAMNRILGDVVHAIRLRLAWKVQRAGLASMERTGRDVLYDAAARETTAITDAGEIVATTLHALVLVVFAAMYVAFLSRPAFAVIVVFVAVCIFIVLRNRAAVHRLMLTATDLEVGYLGAIEDALEGFKESKLHARRRGDLLRHLDALSNRLSAIKVKTAEIYNGNFLFTQYSFYLLIGVIVFVLPSYLPLGPARVTELTMSILFVIAPLTAIVAAIPDIARADIAAATVARVEEALDAAAETDVAEATEDFSGLSELTLDGVRYTHRGEGGETFTVGPVSWTLRRGSVVFIVGGNGSGKSTFLQMLTGLYPAESGTIRVDGRAIGSAELASYRALFSTIFGDFHLFERLYVAEKADPARVAGLLRLMQLDAKTSFDGERFTNLELSTGQRKRLALIVCLLQDRPILILDELAADQDPEFRAFLYEQLLPRLRAEGKTIVAVTHDDRWFAVADEVWRMEYGRLEPLDVRAHG